MGELFKLSLPKKQEGEVCSLLTVRISPDELITDMDVEQGLAGMRMWKRWEGGGSLSITMAFKCHQGRRMPPAGESGAGPTRTAAVQSRMMGLELRGTKLGVKCCESPLAAWK